MTPVSAVENTIEDRTGLPSLAVVGATVGAFPFAVAVTPAAVDRLQHEADLMAERCLLFVACTRARESLYVSYSGEPSPFIGG